MITIHTFQQKKQQAQKISMITCYDYTFARLVENSPIDCILVGDSVAMVMHGFDTTLPATMEMMCLHTSAVRRGAPNKWIITDLPFLSYRYDLSKTMENVQRCMQAGANAIKLEGIAGNEATIRHIVESGVPVMGHLGMTPQSVHQMGGFRVQAKQIAEAKQLKIDAKRCQDAGCFALVLECVPAYLATEISEELQIPTIGIGAGSGTDGQVLVLQDMLGLQLDFKPKFLKQYAPGATMVHDALTAFHDEVVDVTFPSKEESYA